nr:hypothetical protein [Lachnospiraceae bacterium]
MRKSLSGEGAIAHRIRSVFSGGGCIRRGMQGRSFFGDIFRRGMCGSLTLEAAVVLPFFLFFFLSLLSSMELMHFTMRVDHELSRAAKKIAVYASAEGLAPGAVPAGGKGGTA